MHAAALPRQAGRPSLAAAGPATLSLTPPRFAASDGEVLCPADRAGDRPGDAYEPAAISLACGVRWRSRLWRSCDGRAVKDPGVGLGRATRRGVDGVPSAACTSCLPTAPASSARPPVTGSSAPRALCRGTSADGPDPPGCPREMPSSGGGTGLLPPSFTAEAVSAEASVLAGRPPSVMSSAEPGCGVCQAMAAPVETTGAASAAAGDTGGRGDGSVRRSGEVGPASEAAASLRRSVSARAACSSAMACRSRHAHRNSRHLLNIRWLINMSLSRWLIPTSSDQHLVDL